MWVCEAHKLVVQARVCEQSWERAWLTGEWRALAWSVLCRLRQVSRGKSRPRLCGQSRRKYWGKIERKSCDDYDKHTGDLCKKKSIFKLLLVWDWQSSHLFYLYVSKYFLHYSLRSTMTMKKVLILKGNKQFLAAPICKYIRMIWYDCMCSVLPCILVIVLRYMQQFLCCRRRGEVRVATHTQHVFSMNYCDTCQQLSKQVYLILLGKGRS